MSEVGKTHCKNATSESTAASNAGSGDTDGGDLMSESVTTQLGRGQGKARQGLLLLL